MLSNHTASESWALARMLPLLIGDLIPESDPHWLNYLLLLSIVDIIMAPKTTRATAAYLRDLIWEHHTAFKDLYPERPITPKLHYMVHIPEWMIKYVFFHVQVYVHPPNVVIVHLLYDIDAILYSYCDSLFVRVGVGHSDIFGACDLKLSIGTSNKQQKWLAILRILPRRSPNVINATCVTCCQVLQNI